MNENRECAIMTNWWYSLYAVILAVLAIFTGEIVTFIMLGLILLALNNINITLKRMQGMKSDDR